MQEIKNQYEKIIQERKMILEELEQLKKNEIVKRYLELNSKNDVLFHQQEELLKKIKINEYQNCNHVWVTTAIERDSFEGRSEIYKGCIKCGLNQESLKHDKVYNGIDFASFEERLMIDLIKYGGIRYYGVYSNENCDLILANAIYSKIIENHPNIDDQTAKKYFEIALNNIRNIKVNESRVISRRKRLSLNPNFNRWFSENVCN